MSPDLLQRFCSPKGGYRSDLTVPHRLDGVILASDASILVEIPDDGRDLPTVDKMDRPGLPQMFAETLAGVQADVADIVQVGRVVRVEDIALPAPEVCSQCDGTGKVYMLDCPSCDGDGTFEHFGHWYECRLCDGDGWVMDKHVGTLEVCDNCHGTGENLSQSVSVAFVAGQWSFARHYLSLLAKLPGCVLYVPLVMSPGGMASLFTFDGGRGLLMPMR